MATQNPLFLLDNEDTIYIWVSGLLEATGKSDDSTVASVRTLSPASTVESRMSGIGNDLSSQKEKVAQIKTMMQMLINNKVHGNEVASTPVLSKPPYLTGGSGP